MFILAHSVLEDAGSADDVVQEAFIKAYRALPGFKGQARLSTWLHRITYLTAIDMLRKRTRQQRLASDEPEADMADTAPASRGERQLESQQLGQRIEHAMSSLSDLEKSVFNLRHRQDFKLHEIARILDRSEGTVKNVLFRAIRKMRDQLSDTLTDMQEIERC